jgi:hypothetical protein
MHTVRGIFFYAIDESWRAAYKYEDMELIDFLLKCLVLLLVSTVVGVSAGILLWRGSHIQKQARRVRMAKQVLWGMHVFVSFALVLLLAVVLLWALPLDFLGFAAGDQSQVRQALVLFGMAAVVFLTIHPHFYEEYYSRKLR